MSGAALEALQQLLHRRESLAGFEQSLFLESGRDLGNQLTPEPRDVGERSKNPNGRSAKRDDAHELDAVASSAPQQKIFAEPLLVACCRRNAADVLDQELQRDVDEAAIEMAATQTDRKRHRGNLAQRAGRERGRRA